MHGDGIVNSVLMSQQATDKSANCFGATSSMSFVAVSQGCRGGEECAQCEDNGGSLWTAIREG